MSLINDALKKAQVHTTVAATPATVPATPMVVALPSPPPTGEATDRDIGLGTGHIAAIVGVLALTTLAGTAVVSNWQSRRESANAMLSWAAPVKHSGTALLLQTQQALGLAAEMVETSSARTRFPSTAALTPEDTAVSATEVRASEPEPDNTSVARPNSDGPTQPQEAGEPTADSTERVAYSATVIATPEATPHAVTGGGSDSGPADTAVATAGESAPITPAPADMESTFAVTGIMGGSAKRIAIVNRRVVHVGDAIGSARVEEIRGDSVIVEIDGKQYEVPMQIPRR